MVTSAATYNSSAQRAVQHHLSLSLDGGMTLCPARSSIVHTSIGATTGASLNYELQRGYLLFGVGAGAGYQFSRSRLVDYCETYNRTIRGGQQVQYHYVFPSYRETRTLLQARVPLYIGATFAEYMYILGGATVGIDVLADYASEATMYTAMNVPNLPGTISQNIPNYGYGIYPESAYESRGNILPSAIAARVSIAPTFEIGAQIPLANQLKLRVGLYAAYQVKLFPSQAQNPLLDLSEVDLSPYTQSQQDLADHLRFYPLSETSLATRELLNNLVIGLRVTLQLRFTPSRHDCMCYP